MQQTSAHLRHFQNRFLIHSQGRAESLISPSHIRKYAAYAEYQYPGSGYWRQIIKAFFKMATPPYSLLNGDYQRLFTDRTVIYLTAYGQKEYIV